MVDATRSNIMSSIKSKDTKPELVIRKGLHARGIRFRIHCQKLPGRPDVVLKKYNSIILVNGCFWHMHDCHLYNPSRKLSPHWKKKLESNVFRDELNIEKCLELGWRVLVVWECAITGKDKLEHSDLIDQVVNWLENGKANYLQIRGDFKHENHI